MLEFLHRWKRTQEPVEIIGEVEIEVPAADVYALIDWADPRNAKRATGCDVRAVPGKAGRFEMAMPSLADFTFEFLVTCDDPHSCYAFGCMIQPQLGHMEHTHETYHFEELGEDRCRVTLSTETRFVAGLSRRQRAAEMATMAASLQSALQKLKLQAERGADFAKAVEGNLLL